MKDWKMVVGLFCLILILLLSGCGKKKTPAPAKYTLTTEIIGEGSVSVDPEKEFYGSGEAVTLTAVAEEGWKFSRWSGDASGIDPQVTIVMDRNKEVTAVFEKEGAPVSYTLTTDVIGSGSIIVDPKKEVYDSGEEVTLTAVAEEGWKFSGWSGDASGTDPQVTIIMDRNKEVTAVFEELPLSEPLFREDFDAATTEKHFFSTAYRSIPGDPDTPMYYLTGGHVEFVDGQITIGIGDKGGRFTVGQTVQEKDTTAAGVEPNGIFDLSKPYKISLKVIGVSGTLSKKFQVYVDNNTTNSDKSFHGSASKVYEKKLEDFTENEEVVISLSVGTAHSFIQVRVESGGYITFDDLVIEYIE